MRPSFRLTVIVKLYQISETVTRGGIPRRGDDLIQCVANEGGSPCRFHCALILMRFQCVRPHAGARMRAKRVGC